MTLSLNPRLRDRSRTLVAHRREWCNRARWVRMGLPGRFTEGIDIPTEHPDVTPRSPAHPRTPPRHTFRRAKSTLNSRPCFFGFVDGCVSQWPVDVCVRVPEEVPPAPSTWGTRFQPGQPRHTSGGQRCTAPRPSPSPSARRCCGEPVPPNSRHSRWRRCLVTCTRWVGAISRHVGWMHVWTISGNFPLPGTRRT